MVLFVSSCGGVTVGLWGKCKRLVGLGLAGGRIPRQIPGAPAEC